jgi:hypothetical protein
MHTDTYMPGYSAPMVSFMAQRGDSENRVFVGSAVYDESYCSLDNKNGDDSLFVALAWCEAIG